MNNTEDAQQVASARPGIFNWFARYEESAHPSEYQVNLPSAEKAEQD